MTEEECTDNGGHCFDATGEMLPTDPPQYPEVCKHCAKRRVGIPQPSMIYEDA